jgi:hypothetical protein
VHVIVMCFVSFKRVPSQQYACRTAPKDGHGYYLAQSVWSYAMGWTMGFLGFDSWRGLGIFLSTTASRTALGPTQPPIQLLTGALSLGVERPVREATTHLHPVPRSKNVWSYTSTPEYAFMAWCSGKKDRDNFTLP